ncbi:IS630 transposase-related protein (plasmid) [Candidatus Fukatsuia symbiotica]|uniref:IS630 transposase-related protein n=1 Tax=Candidatus Fukatsuia symbiotica TaxID=1878942 RepID=UPI001F07B6CA|nr:IS630 transposase-related protein [Candidatus Fukatsuia symbiotica]MEA9445834.1 IS630 transposase-related protein [Candidatus Fukatsuia symbiotica]
MCGDSEPNALGWAKRIDPCLTRDKPATKINRAALLLDVETYPEASQYERAQRMGGSARGICDALKRAGFSYKKTFYHPKIDVQARKKEMMQASKNTLNLSFHLENFVGMSYSLFKMKTK